MLVCLSTEPFQRLTSFIGEAGVLLEEHNSLPVHRPVSAVPAPGRSLRHSGALRTWEVVMGRRLVEEACYAWDIRQAGRSFQEERSSIR
jgi:hypothetical protein